MNARTLNVSATAAAELKAVLEEIEVPAEFLDGPDGPGLQLPGAVRIHVRSAARPSLTQLRRWGLQDEAPEGETQTTVVVADWIDPDLRDQLRSASWGWLERSGHLRLVVGGFHIDRQVAPLLGPGAQVPSPLRRESGLAVAVELLDLGASGGDREWGATVRDVAAAAAVSVGSAHKAITELTELAMLGPDGRPRSALFWAVAREWEFRWFPLSGLPAASVSETLQRLLRLRLDDVAQAGWAASGDAAAAAYGAPIVGEGSPRLLVPDRRALTWALRTFGEAADDRSAAAYVAVPPTAAAVRRRHTGHPWPLVRPIVAALQLAASGPRGREALERWPDQPVGDLDGE